nr:MAG TPA: hypothetical protein [Caudoviricetes sp.]
MSNNLFSISTPLLPYLLFTIDLSYSITSLPLVTKMLGSSEIELKYLLRTFSSSYVAIGNAADIACNK